MKCEVQQQGEKEKERIFQIYTLKSTKEERTTFIRFQLSFFQFCPTTIILHSWAQLLILNTLQGTRNRRDAGREQLAGLKPGQPTQGSHQISAPSQQLPHPSSLTNTQAREEKEPFKPPNIKKLCKPIYFVTRIQPPSLLQAVWTQT